MLLAILHLERLGLNRSLLPGYARRIMFRFRENGICFNCSASTRNVSMRPVELGKDELIFTYERPDQDVAATKVEFDRELAQIKQTLGWRKRFPGFQFVASRVG